MKAEIDTAAIQSVKSLLGELEGKYKTVLTTSINKTLSTVKTQAAARVGNELNLKAARIKQDMLIEKANFSKLSGAFRSVGEPVGLIQYAAVDGATGVTVKVLKTGGKKLLKHAFISPGKNGGLHVWWRGGRSRMPEAKKFPVGQKSYAAWHKMPTESNKYRFPVGPKGDRGVLRLTGPRIEDILAKDQVFEPLNIQAGHVYLMNVDAQIVDVIRRFG